MRILMYGIGKGLAHVEEVLDEQHQIVGYMDSYSKISFYKKNRFYPIDKVKEIDFDFIVITIKDRKTAWEVFNLLQNDYNIKREKIVPFYIYARSELYYRRYCKNKDDEIEGIILGNSHAHCAFLTEFMSRKFVNLASPSQDIYCNYKILLECKKNINKFKRIKYLIFDLYDYNYFNVDISRQRGFMDYISLGGVLEEHNYKENKNFHNKFEEEVFKQTYILVNKSFCKNTMQSIFGDNYCWDDEKNENNRWIHIDSQVEVPVNVIGGNNVISHHDSTIKENLVVMEKIIKEIKEVSDEIEIIFTLIPRYEAVEVIMSSMLFDWKKGFMDIIIKFQKEYNVHFWDFKRYKQISDNVHFYYDACHLNTVGGRCLTTILENKINEVEKEEKG